MKKFPSYILKGENKETNHLYLMNSYNGCSLKVSKDIFNSFESLQENEQMDALLIEEGFYDSFDNAVATATNKENTSLNLTLLIHENCNFRCTYCYEKFEKNAMSKEVMDSIIDYIEYRIQSDELIEDIHLAWFGGEPLLNLKGIEYISSKVIGICEKYGKIYSSDITTNGFLLTKKVYEKLTSLKVTNYQVTIDGKSEDHDAQRILANGKGTYNRIMSNLIDISQNTNDTNLIAIRTNVGPKNFDTMEEHISNLISIFGEDERFDLTYHNIGNWGETCVDVIDNNVALGLSELTVKKGGKSEGILWNLMPNSYCYAGKKNNYLIGSDGLIYKCTVLLYNERNKIGKIENGRFIIDGEKEKPWIEDKRTDKCGQCPIAMSCLNKKCPASLLTEKVANCLFKASELERLLKLMDNQDLMTYSIV